MTGQNAAVAEGMATPGAANLAQNSTTLPPIGGAANRDAVNPWLIAITVTLATFMELLDTAIANVSLPHIAGGLACSYDEATWVLTSYLVANAVVLPLSAWLSRVFGRKRYYMICVALFTLSSALCGMAPNLGMLIFFRVLQGIGGGGLAPVEQAILVDTFPPHKRAAAFALYSMAIVTAPALGPPLGGWITDSFSWRWVFLINIPIGLISLFLSNRLVHDSDAFKKEVSEARSAGKLRIDGFGIFLVALGFAFLEVVLDRGEREEWFDSTFICVFFGVAMISLLTALWWELRHPDPVVEVRLLKERNFAIANILYFVFGFVLFGSTVMIPQMLQSLMGYTATDAGLVLGPGAFVIVVLAPFVVRLLPKIGAKRMIGFGLTVLGCAMWYFSTFDTLTDYKHEAWARALQGFGLAFLFVPVSQVAYSRLPKNKNNKASSLTNLFRNQGGSFGIAFVTTMLARRAQYHQSVLVETINNTDPATQSAITSMSQTFAMNGAPQGTADAMAKGQIYQMVQDQSHMLAFIDCFYALGWVAFCAATLAFFIVNVAPAPKPEEPAH
ncbi:MAG: DHA2 family efflux MFS transporter permease subunit [Micavibrio sp.]|nr:DHA2 family efflux MFS transporter permease subunit [Micavibrio sp.]